MAIRIHHTQVKQAAKLGIVLTKSDMDVTASKDGQSASAPSAGLAIAALLRKLNTTTADVMKTLAPKSPAKTARGAEKKAKKAKRKAARSEDDEDGDEDESDDGASVVKRKYKQAYRPHKMTCGDALSQQIRKEFMTIKDPDTRKLKLDWKRFTAFAKTNGCWSEDYIKLNKGMRRMNVVNRLRAKINADHKVVWTA